MPDEKASQSQSFTGSPVSGQVGQGRDFQQIQSHQAASPEKQLSTPEAIELLSQLETLLQDADLPAPEKEKAIRYLGAAQEAAKEEDKEFAAGSLKRMNEKLQTAGETFEASQNLWQKVKPILASLVTWLGVATDFFGF
ncbi:MAG: hypothetical protein RID53_08475 [Coleofasciculus sp. B1-GNL1-01]|uniref:hypothetical protein n=1 Tax=Coleofasciculus sp. B1-GNL1-01 TaxID=3068484 RepID=UPI0032FAC518